MVSKLFVIFLLSTTLWLTVTSRKCHGKDIHGSCDHYWNHLNRCHPTPGDQKTQGISQNLLDDFVLMSQYAAAAYWPGNNNSTGTPLSCSDSPCEYVPRGNCPLVEQANATTTEEFEDTPQFDDHGKSLVLGLGTGLTMSTGFIAVDHVHKLVVLSFRGSASQQNWIENLKFGQVCTDLCPHCGVHHGFWEQWKGMSLMVISNMVAATAAHPDYRVIVTGHSLGGAVASLAAADLRKNSSHLMDHTELFTYGSPRVGNVHTAAFLTQQSSKSYRITARADPVPRVPGPLFGYLHMSPEYWIRTRPEDHMLERPDDPTTDDFYVLTGYYNHDGNTGTDWRSFDEHRHYFGYISKCDPNPPGEPEKLDWYRRLIEGIV